MMAKCLTLAISLLPVSAVASEGRRRAPAEKQCQQQCGGITKMFSYERAPKNDAGGQCVGGCSGAEYSHHVEKGIVRSISVWWDSHVDSNSGVKAVRVQFFNDPAGEHTRVVGNAANPKAQYKEISFKPGETIKGDVVLSGNGYGTRLGYVKFTTSAGQTFEAGQSGHIKYLFDSGDSFISGIGGRAGSDVDQMFFYFWKPIKSLWMVDIKYPTLSAIASFKSPTIIASKTYCNSNSEDRKGAEEIETKTVTSGYDSCFHSTATETFGGSIQVKAGLPGFAQTKAETHWEVKAEQEFQNCKQTSETSEQHLKFPIQTIAAHTRFAYQFTQWQGQLQELPFTATLKIQFFDGSILTQAQSGSYQGAAYSEVSQSYTSEETHVTDCGKLGNSTIIV